MKDLSTNCEWCKRMDCIVSFQIPMKKKNKKIPESTKIENKQLKLHTKQNRKKEKEELERVFCSYMFEIKKHVKRGLFYKRNCNNRNSLNRKNPSIGLTCRNKVKRYNTFTCKTKRAIPKLTLSFTRIE